MSEIRKALENENVSEEKIKEVLNALGINESKRWKPSLYEAYRYIGSGFVYNYRWSNSLSDGYLWLLGDIFRTKEEAVKKLEKRYFLEKMKRDFEDNSDLVDWDDAGQNKYCIYRQNDELRTFAISTLQASGSLHTTNGEWLEQYISDNEQQIKKYCFGIE